MTSKPPIEITVRCSKATCIARAGKGINVPTARCRADPRFAALTAAMKHFKRPQWEVRIRFIRCIERMQGGRHVDLYTGFLK
jgi:hypothetical protein